MLWLSGITFLLAGVAVGIVSSLFGIGGGTILVPLFTLVFGYTIHHAIATSLVIIVPTALMGAYRHAASGKIAWKIAGLIAVGGILGANLGVDLSMRLSETSLRRLFVGLLLFMAAQMFFSKSSKSKVPERAEASDGADDPEGGQASDRAGASDIEQASDRTDASDRIDVAKRSAPVGRLETSGRTGENASSPARSMSLGRAVLFVLTGVLMGVVSSLFGIGGGILLVPMMTLGFKMKVHEAVAISLAVIVPTSIMGAFRHAVAGNVPWLAAALVAIGGLAGAHLGAGWALRLSERALRRLFALFLVLVAVRMYFSA